MLRVGRLVDNRRNRWIGSQSFGIEYDKFQEYVGVGSGLGISALFVSCVVIDRFVSIECTIVVVFGFGGTAGVYNRFGLWHVSRAYSLTAVLGNAYQYVGVVFIATQVGKEDFFVVSQQLLVGERILANNNKVVGIGCEPVVSVIFEYSQSPLLFIIICPVLK